MNLRGFVRIAIDTAALTGVLLFIFAAASSFSWTLTVAYLPQRLVTLLQSVGDSPTIFMICSIVLLILVGVLLEGLPSLNVLAPLLHSDRRQARPQRTALCAGADHRDGHRRLHAVRRRRVLRLLRRHALRHRDRLARDAALSRSCCWSGC